MPHRTPTYIRYNDSADINPIVHHAISYPSSIFSDGSIKLHGSTSTSDSNGLISTFPSYTTFMCMWRYSLSFSDNVSYWPGDRSWSKGLLAIRDTTNHGNTRHDLDWKLTLDDLSRLIIIQPTDGPSDCAKVGHLVSKEDVWQELRNVSVLRGSWIYSDRHANRGIPGTYPQSRPS